MLKATDDVPSEPVTICRQPPPPVMGDLRSVNMVCGMQMRTRRIVRNVKMVRNALILLVTLSIASFILLFATSFTAPQVYIVGGLTLLLSVAFSICGFLGVRKNIEELMCCLCTISFVDFVKNILFLIFWSMWFANLKQALKHCDWEGNVLDANDDFRCSGWEMDEKYYDAYKNETENHFVPIIMTFILIVFSLSLIEFWIYAYARHLDRQLRNKRNLHVNLAEPNSSGVVIGVPTSLVQPQVRGFVVSEDELPTDDGDETDYGLCEICYMGCGLVILS